MRYRSLGPAVLMGSLLLAGCSAGGTDPEVSRADRGLGQEDAEPASAEPVITLAFGGDVHFEGGLAGIPAEPDATLGKMSGALRDADLAMVNLESALGTTGAPARKELEVPGQRYWFRSPPGALDVLDRSGVDVASIANNHGADYGAAGLRDTLRVAEQSPVGVVGVGRDRAEAFEPHRTTVKGTDVAVLAADSAMRESADAVWAAGEGGPGIASARGAAARNLVAAVSEADRTDDLVVVYLHWGYENKACPTQGQARLAESLAEAGADIVVGSHAHLLLGSGMLDETYVNYGLGNFLWYHGRQPATGVLRLRVQGEDVVDEDWLPAEIPLDGGRPEPVTGGARGDALADQERRRDCTTLTPAPGSADAEAAEAEAAEAEAERTLPPYAAQVREIGPGLRRRMTGASHDPATCPVSLADLRHVTVRHVDLGGRMRVGVLVVADEVARDVVDVFGELYRARWPIARMRLVDAYGADDDRSMAANNSSAYNCRTVAGQDNLSDHAYGRAIDLNPIQNPYVTPDGVVPPAGARYADVDRSRVSAYQRGVIRDGDVVVRAFESVGWEWGDGFADYQHFFVP